MSDPGVRGRLLSELIHEAAEESPAAAVKAFDQCIGEEVAAHTATLRKLHRLEADLAAARVSLAEVRSISDAQSAVLDAVTGLVRAMADFRPFGRHSRRCYERMVAGDAPCECGFADASAALDDANDALNRALGATTTAGEGD